MLELEVKNLNKRFGGLHVLKDVTFGIKGAELVGLIGPNGAGKTTLTNILDGAIKPSSGTVYLNGKRIDQLPPFEVAKPIIWPPASNVAPPSKLVKQKIPANLL